ncbi:MAG: hypothetical protein JWM16_2627, partial [Verrucomicrobiales bacterium]|nr:hypothetical protein [Verrucomicrobiales bacterium]
MSSETNSPLADLALDRYTVKHWTASDGLPAGRIQALCQTRDGYLWVGMRNGLARFNGSEFKVLPYLNCSSLAEDDDGVLWAGTSHGLYQGSAGKFERIDTHPAPTRTEPEAIFGMCPAKGGGAWVYDSESLVFVRGTSVHRHTKGKLGNQHPRAMCTDGEGRVWVAGLIPPHRWDPAKDLMMFCPELPAWFSTNAIWSLYRDGAGAIWFGTWFTSAYRLWDGNTQEYPRVNHPAVVGINSLAEDETGTMWVSCSGGISLIKDRKIHFSDLNTNNFGGHPVLIPNQGGGIWVGTQEKGLYLVQRKKVAVLGKAEGLNHDSVWSIAEGHDQSMWIGTFDGLDRMKRGKLTHYGVAEGLTTPLVRAVAVDKEGRAWVGTGGEKFGESGGLHVIETNELAKIV